MPTVAYGTVPFQDQIAFFRRKRNVLTESYLDVWDSQHDTSFMVAGANRDDLLADLREAIRKAIDSGNTLEDFRRDFDRIVSTYGWDYNGGRNWRSRVIYETNLRQSYNAGRWAQLQRLKKTRPWWRYRHSDAVEHPRPEHVAWDGMILHCDDPWWLTHFPANGWGCQCYVEALSDRDLKRLGKTGPDKAPAVDMQPVIIGLRSPGGPRTVMTPAGVDPGFGYAPGASVEGWPQQRGGPQTPPSLQSGVEHALQTALEKTTRLPVEAAAQSAAQSLSRPRALDALQAGFTQWRRAHAAGDGRVERYLIGALHPLTTERLATTAGIRPLTAALQVNAAHWTAGELAKLVKLPALLYDGASVAAVLLDVAAGMLRYVLTGAGDRRTVVDVLLQTEGPQAANTVSASVVQSLADLHRGVSGGQLRLIQGDIGP
jgi:Phage Mu protein F like protein